MSLSFWDTECSLSKAETLLHRLAVLVHIFHTCKYVMTSHQTQGLLPVLYIVKALGQTHTSFGMTCMGVTGAPSTSIDNTDTSLLE